MVPEVWESGRSFVKQEADESGWTVVREEAETTHLYGRSCVEEAVEPAGIRGGLEVKLGTAFEFTKQREEIGS